MIIHFQDLPGVVTTEQVANATANSPALRKALVDTFEKALADTGSPVAAIRAVEPFLIELARPKPQARCYCDCRHCPDR